MEAWGTVPLRCAHAMRGQSPVGVISRLICSAITKHLFTLLKQICTYSAKSAHKPLFRAGSVPKGHLQPLSAEIRGKRPRHAAFRREKSPPPRRTWKVLRHQHIMRTAAETLLPQDAS